MFTVRLYVIAFKNESYQGEIPKLPMFEQISDGPVIAVAVWTTDSDAILVEIIDSIFPRKHVYVPCGSVSRENGKPEPRFHLKGNIDTRSKYRQTGRLLICGANRDRKMQIRCSFQLRLTGDGQDKRHKLEWLFYLHYSRLRNSVPIQPACPESPRSTVV